MYHVLKVIESACAEVDGHLLVRFRAKRFKGERAVIAAEQDVSFFLNVFVIARQHFMLYCVYVSGIWR